MQDLKCHLPQTALPSKLTEWLVESSGGNSLTKSASESLSPITKTAEKYKNKSEAQSFWVQCRTERSAEDKVVSTESWLRLQTCPCFVSILGEWMEGITFTEAIWGCETHIWSCSCEGGGRMYAEHNLSSGRDRIWSACRSASLSVVIEQPALFAPQRWETFAQVILLKCV